MWANCYKVTGKSGFLSHSSIVPPQSPHSFLDRRSSGLVPDPPRLQSVSAAAAEQPIYDAVMGTMQLEASSYLPYGASQASASNTSSFGLEEPFEPEQASFQYQLYNSQAHLLRLLSNAPLYMSAADMDPIVYSLQQMADIVRAFYTPLRIHPASIVDSHIGGENGTNVFSDMTASSETDQTILSNVLPDGTQVFSRYDRPPNDMAGGDGAHAIDSDQNCLAHVFDPPVFDSEADSGDAEFYRYLNL